MKLKIDGNTHTLREFNLEEWKQKTPKPRVVNDRGVEVKDLSYLPTCSEPRLSLVGTVRGKRFSWHPDGTIIDSHVSANRMDYSDLYIAEELRCSRRLLTMKEIIDRKGVEMYVCKGDYIATVVERNVEANTLSFGAIRGTFPLSEMHREGYAWSDGATEPGKGVVWYSFEAYQYNDNEEIELIDISEAKAK